MNTSISLPHFKNMFLGLQSGMYQLFKQL